MKTLSITTRVQVRFSEVDSLGVVWHGNYVQYLEDGREAFGRAFDLEYMRIYREGHVTPVVEMQMRYHQSARVDDILEVETTYIPDPGAKMIYEYAVRRPCDGALLLTARSMQVFQTTDGEFVVSKPDFIREWEQLHGLEIPQRSAKSRRAKKK